MLIPFAAFGSLLVSALTAPAPSPVHAPPPTPTPPSSAAPAPPPSPAPAGVEKDAVGEEQPVVTHHSITFDGHPFAYTVTAGMMPLKDAAGEAKAKIFYIAYHREGEPANRPLLFAFNGGPGSSSVWLHLGTIGPRRVLLLTDGAMPRPPFTLVDNESTWLDQADLVFIDPVGTGFSQAIKPENNKDYWGAQPDIQSVAEFMRMYLTRNSRWGSPLFVAGESYGTFRAAGLADELQNDGIALNGVILVSSVLNFQALSFAPGDDSSYVAYLPTYAATAWFHHKLPADLQRQTLEAVLIQAERFAATRYRAALAQGDALPADERKSLVAQVARFTGLRPEYVDESNLRIVDERFRKELLRSAHKTLGRYDSRFTGVDPDSAGEGTSYDPSYAAVSAPFTMAFNRYIRDELGFKTDRPYQILAPVSWDFGRRGGYAETASRLRMAIAQEPYLKAYVVMGDYDMATPYFGAEYVVDHMGLGPTLRDRVEYAHYRSGHMVYLDEASRQKMKADITAFIDSALGRPPSGAANGEAKGK